SLEERTAVSALGWLPRLVRPGSATACVALSAPLRMVTAPCLPLGGRHRIRRELVDPHHSRGVVGVGGTDQHRRGDSLVPCLGCLADVAPTILARVVTMQCLAEVTHDSVGAVTAALESRRAMQFQRLIVPVVTPWADTALERRDPHLPAFLSLPAVRRGAGTGSATAHRQR